MAIRRPSLGAVSEVSYSTRLLDSSVHLMPWVLAHILCWLRLEYCHSIIPLCLYLGRSFHLNALSTSIAIYESLGACVHARAKLLQSCLTLCDPMDCNPPGSSVHGSPGKNTGVGCQFLLQCMKVKSESEVAQSCPTLSDPMNCSLPGSSIHTGSLKLAMVSVFTSPKSVNLGSPPALRAGS